MAVLLFPSSFRCDCGHEAHFFENTIRDLRKMSRKRDQRLGDGDHTIVFHKGEPTEIKCPKLGRCVIDGEEEY